MDIAGRKLFLKALKQEEVDTVFVYPGGVVTDLLDELGRDGSIRLILARHEQALIHEAEGYARASGKVAVCIVTSGPGATNTVTGLTDAFYDSIPLVCFTGQVSVPLIGNDAFQEVDMIGITRNVTKYGVTVSDRKNLGKIIKEAFYIANTGKKGPVVVDLPKNIQVEKGSGEYPDKVSIRGYKPNESVHVGQLKKAYKLLKGAKKPLILAGGGVNVAHANDELLKFVEKTHVPVVSTVMGKGGIPTGHEYYMGNSGMHGAYACNMAISECDVLFSIGCRFNDRVTGSLDDFAPNAKIVHIDIDTASISRNVVVDVPVVADANVALQKLNEWASVQDTSEWIKEIKSWDNEYPLKMPNVDETRLSPQSIMEGINSVFRNSFITVDVGQHQMWASQFLQLDSRRHMITSGGLGTMGFGFPAAIGAKAAIPDTPVICITGDGGFQMNMQEMAVSVTEHLPVITCLLNNKVLGMVRQMQNLFYGKRFVATDLANDRGEAYVPDFMKWAQSYGIEAIRVTDKDQILPALKKAGKMKERSVLIEFVIDQDEIVLPMVKGGDATSDMIL